MDPFMSVIEIVLSKIMVPDSGDVSFVFKNGDSIDCTKITTEKTRKGKVTSFPAFQCSAKHGKDVIPFSKEIVHLEVKPDPSKGFKLIDNEDGVSISFKKDAICTIDFLRFMDCEIKKEKD